MKRRSKLLFRAVFIWDFLIKKSVMLTKKIDNYLDNDKYSFTLMNNPFFM